MPDDQPSTAVTAAPASSPSFFDQLLPASFRGIPFAVFGGQARFGRRNVVHEYPFRDTPWIEDLGRQSRRITMAGFIVENDPVTGQGGVIAQRDCFIAAAERPGDGALVHPTLGNLTVSLIEFESTERWDRGRMFELSFTFIEAGQRRFPDEGVNGTGAIGDAADQTCKAASDIWSDAIGGDIGQDVGITDGIGDMTQQWTASAANAAGAATSLMNIATSLRGNYGRLLGQNSGIPFDAVLDGDTTLDDLIGAAAAARSDVSLANGLLSTESVGVDGASLGDFFSAATALADAVRKASFTPADAIRSMTAMATLPRPAEPVRAATTDLFRRIAVSGVAKASAAYQPSTTEEAQAVRAQVLAVIDAEMDIAGDQGDDTVYTAMRGLRAEVIRDMNAKGAQLPGLVTVRTPGPVPALVLAQRLYRDPTRADELVRRANPPHPAFMPGSFRALSS